MESTTSPSDPTQLIEPLEEGQPFTPTDQLLDFHPSCVGFVTHRFPSYCVVNRDVYVSNKLLEHLPAPVRVGRTQLRLTVKSVNQGNYRWKAVSAWPVSDGEDRVHTTVEEEGTTRARSGSMLAAVSEVPEVGPAAAALEVREAVGWVGRQLERVKMEHQEIATMVSNNDSGRSADTQTRVATLVCATHDGLQAAITAYSELATLLNASAAPSPRPEPQPIPKSPLRVEQQVRSDESRRGPSDDVGSRRRSVSERSDVRAETDLAVAASRLRTLLKDTPLPVAQIPAAYLARFHISLEPIALGFGRLGQLLRALGLGGEPWEGTSPITPTAPSPSPQLPAAVDAMLRANGPMPVDMLAARLQEQGLAPMPPAALLEAAGAWGFAVAGDVVGSRLPPEGALPAFSLQYDGSEAFGDWGGLRPRASSAPHVFPSPWDPLTTDTWNPQSPNTSWDTQATGAPSPSPSRPGWEDSHVATSPTPSRRSQARPTKLFVGGINPITTERTLSRYFVRFGRLVDCFIAKTPGAGPNFAPRSRGFGFVTFAHSSSADMVLRSGPHVLDDRALDVKTAVPKEAMQSASPATTPNQPQGQWTPPGRMAASPFRHGFSPAAEEGQGAYYDYPS